MQLKWTRETGKIVDGHGNDAKPKIEAAEKLLKQYRTVAGRGRGGSASTFEKSAKPRESAKQRNGANAS